MPCFDQPDVKGRWTITLQHPAQWQSVSNGAERERRRSGDQVRVRFHQTQPLPTYLIAFVVGDMKIETAVRHGRTMRMFHREDDVAKLARNRDALTRAVAWSALWDAMIAERMSPGRWYDMAVHALSTERDAQLIGDWVGDLQIAWWQFLTPAQRAERAPALEALLRSRLDAATDPGLKSTWFGTLRNMATTTPTVTWLRALWQRDATIPGLPLVEADETALAYALAVRGVEGEQLLLDAQRDRITNPDRKARFELVRAAADAGERERWFQRRWTCCWKYTQLARCSSKPTGSMQY
jgi:Peptidase M1 N-terminal domain